MVKIIQNPFFLVIIRFIGLAAVIWAWGFVPFLCLIVLLGATGPFLKSTGWNGHTRDVIEILVLIVGIAAVFSAFGEIAGTVILCLVILHIFTLSPWVTNHYPTNGEEDIVNRKFQEYREAPYRKWSKEFMRAYESSQDPELNEVKKNGS